MTDEDDLEVTWHTGLFARPDSSFPKKCMNCGRVFQNAEQYFTETEDISEQDKGLKSYEEESATIVEAFRNCPCGSTLMEMFDDHRDELQEEVARKKREEEIAESIKVEVPVAEKVWSVLPEETTVILNQLAVGSESANGREQWSDAWYEGLCPKADSAFPKKCRSCGRIFETPNDFFTETIGTGAEKTGLKECVDDDDGVLLEAFRNCPCGSTLMDNFSDRRDMTAAGSARRAQFLKMLNFLTQSGLDAEVAYAELLKVARGGESNILAKIKPPK